MSWDPKRLHATLEELRARGGDKTNVEVKSGRNGLPELGDTLAAFGNMPDGGTVIIGVAEGGNFSITGIGGQIADYEAGLASLARDCILPPLHLDFYSLSLTDGDVVIAEVQGLPLSDRPARFRGKAYLRQADGDYELSEQELQQLEILKSQQTLRTQPDKKVVAGTSVDDLDPDLVVMYIKTCRERSRTAANWTDEQVLYNTAVTSKDGEITLAGLYALGIAPQREFPQLSITAAVQLPFDGSGRRTRDLAHFTGPIPDLLYQAEEWVRRNTRPLLVYSDDGHARDKDELPMEAIREIIANALVHRNLDPITDTKMVEIRLRNDVLTITSPGGLWGVSESQLGHPGTKSAVNPVLYQICKNTRGKDGIRVIEGEGGGIIEAINQLRAAHLRTPRFIDKGIGFTVLISRHTLLNNEQLEWIQSQEIQPKTSSEARAVLASMREGTEWNKARIRRHFSISSDEAGRILEQVRAHPEVQAKGDGRGRMYYMNTPTGTIAEHMTKNGPLVLDAMEHGPLMMREIASKTGLSPRATQYALSWLIEHDMVEMLGGQGDPQTRYGKKNPQVK